MLIVLTFAIAALFAVLAVVACLRWSHTAAPLARRAASAGTPACVAAHARRPRGRKRGAGCGHGARLRR